MVTQRSSKMDVEMSSSSGQTSLQTVQTSLTGPPFNLNRHMIALRILFVDVVAFLLYCVYCLLLRLRLLV